MDRPALDRFPRAWMDSLSAQDFALSLDAPAAPRKSGHNAHASGAREPSFELHNLEARPRVVELAALFALDTEGTGSTALTISAPTRILLALNESLTFSVTYVEDPVQTRRGLTHYRFELRAVVDGDAVSATASNAYICRIPNRR